MEVQIARDGTIIGYLDFHELEDALDQEAVLPTDYGWHEGLTEWRLLSELCSQTPCASSVKEPPPSFPNPNSQPPTKRSWRDDPATEKQINYLNSFGVTTTQNLTKGGASDLIDKCQNDPQALKIRSDNQFKEWEASMEKARSKRAEQGAYSFRLDINKAVGEIEAMKVNEADRVTKIRAKRDEMAVLRQELKSCSKEDRGALKDRIIQIDVQLSRLESELPLDPSDIKDAKADLKQLEMLRAKFWRCTFKDDWLLSPDASEYSELVDVADTINRLYDEYGRYFKTPGAKQITAVLAALDGASLDWDLLKPESFFATIKHNFPEQLRGSLK